MKLLLLNVHSSQNAGDLAILQETLLCLHTAFPNADVTVAINDRESEHLPPGARYVGSFMRWVVVEDTKGEWHWRKGFALLQACWLILAASLFRLFDWQFMPSRAEQQELMQAYYTADAVVVIGGGHLYARHALNIAFAWLWLGLALAIIMRKPLVLLPQSFGPLPGKLQRRMLAWLVARCTFVATREYQSLKLLHVLHVRQPILVLPDMAFASQPIAEQTIHIPILNDISDKHEPLIGFTLMNWEEQNPQFRNQMQYEQAVLELIQHVKYQYGARVVLFAQCTGPTAGQDDRRIAKRLAAAAAMAQVSVLVADELVTPEMLKAAYQQLDVLVATRMHSAIFALSAEVPTLVIGYLHKSSGIMEMLGLNQHVIDINDVDSRLLQERFDNLWLERENVRNHLSIRIPAVRATLQYLPILLRQSIVSP